MIPLYLEFQAFGPYPRKEYIDFTVFGSQGVFLIRGETGSGKTVILDAITYALYGRSSGAGRGDLVSMRCQHAEDATVTYTNFTFRSGNKEYRFIRSLYRRRKRSGIVEYEPRQDAYVRSEAGEWIPIFANPRRSDVDAEAVRLTGLQYEQFRQVIILPQGQFERLLVANSEEKEQILSTLFGTTDWGKAAELLSEKARNAQREAERQGVLCRSLLEARNCANLEELYSQQEKVSTEIRKNAILLETLHKTQREIQSELTAATALEKDYLRLDEVRSVLQHLSDRQTDIKQKQELLKIKDFAIVYHQWNEAQSEAIKRRQQVRDQQQAIYACDEKIRSYEDMLQFQDERVVVLQQRASREAELVELCALHKQAEEKEKEIIRTMGMIERLGREADFLTQEQMECQEIYEKASRSYWKQVESSLASELIEGKACPVCGSREHPKPAKSPRGVSVTAAQLDDFFQKADALHRSLGEKYSEIQVLRAAMEKQQCELREQGRYTSEEVVRACKDLESARDAKSKLNAFLEKRANTSEHLSRLRVEREDLNIKKEKMLLLSERFQENEKILRARVQELDPNELYASRLKDHYISPESYAEIERDIELYEAEMQEAIALEQALTKQLQGMERPELAEIQTRAKAVSASLQKLEREDVLCRKELEEFSLLRTRYEAEYEKYEKLSERAERETRFARLLRGSNGIGLQRYVLGAMLSAVTEEANRLLQNVHNGRYQIYRTDNSSGLTRKAGLELEVLDRWSGQRRAVTSLSGGEKFLVALSLSIGLSSAVQARAASNKLGAVFIDEGFGTLDRNSMQDALNILAAIGVSSGIVGIISHVQVLQEIIPSGILVQKNSRGSKLHVICD